MGGQARTRLRGSLRAGACLVLAGCGARTPLGPGDGAGRPTIPSEAVSDAGADSRAPTDAATDALEAAPTCLLDDLTTWQTERYRDMGDYERTAVAVSGVPWVALKVRGGNVVLAKLGLDATQGGIVFVDRIEIVESPVYPVALDVDDRRFVLMTTSGINWNGDVALWRIDRQTGTVVHTPVGNPPTDPAFTASSAIGLAGDDVVLAYARLADNMGTIELRDDQLQVLQSLPVTETSFTAVRTSPTAIDLYAGTTSLVHAESGMLTQQPVDPTWHVIGGLEGFLVEIDGQIRMTHGAEIWSAPWPHSQISPPAVVRTYWTHAVFSLETELTAVVGHVTNAGLVWLNIESAPGASGAGLGLLPVIEPGRLGLFYLGLEIPKPEQPLRYYGLSCR